jgi:plastocyanin
MKWTALTLALTLAFPLAAQAEAPEFAITIKDHRFDPAVVTIPADTKVKLVIDNQDPTPEEFESHDLNREKVIPGNTKANIWVGPLKPGTYSFIGEFHQDTAAGKIVAK